MDGLTPIPTTYKGIEFRSKLEANVAHMLDAAKVKWGYELESFTLPGGVLYLPDFWLPDARQFVEVKGVADDPSVEKCRLLAQCVRAPWGDNEEWGRPAAVVVLSQPFVRTHLGAANEVFGYGWNGADKVDALLVTCPTCAVRFFMTTEQGWTCTACLQQMKEPWRVVMLRVKHRRGVTTYEEI